MKLFQDVNNRALALQLPLREEIEDHLKTEEGIFNNHYRLLSEAFFRFIEQTRTMYQAGAIELSEADVEILESDLGQYGDYFGKQVPLDCPMVDEEELTEDEDGDKDHIEEEKKYFNIGIECLDGLIKYVEKEDNDANSRRKKEYKKIAEQSRELRDLMKKHLDGYKEQVDEAKKNGRDVDLNKPMRSSGPKKFKVYVKNKKGNVIQVNFGAKEGGGNLAVKLDDPEARKNFAARHKCDQRNDKTTPSYWSCRLPRYAKQLGLSGGGSHWW